MHFLQFAHDLYQHIFSQPGQHQAPQLSPQQQHTSDMVYNATGGVHVDPKVMGYPADNTARHMPQVPMQHPYAPQMPVHPAQAPHVFQGGLQGNYPTQMQGGSIYNTQWQGRLPGGNNSYQPSVDEGWTGGHVLQGGQVNPNDFYRNLHF